MLVRKAGSRDLDALVELCAGLFAEDGGHRDAAIDVGWPRREGRRYFHRVIGDADTLGIVAEVHDMAVAYLVGRIREPADARPVRVADLEAMYVLPDHPIEASVRRWSASSGAGPTRCGPSASP